MKVSLERKILFGYIINIIVIIALGLIYWSQMPLSTNKFWHWISLVLIVLSIGMLTTVFFILKAQHRAKKQSELELLINQNKCYFC